MDIQPSLDEKKAFFARLEQVNNYCSDDEIDVDEERRKEDRAGNQRPERAITVSSAAVRPRILKSVAETPQRPRRTTSAPTLTSATTNAIIIERTPLLKTAINQALHSKRDGLNADSSFVEETPPIRTSESSIMRRSTVPMTPSEIRGRATEDSPLVTIPATGKRKRKSSSSAPPIPESAQMFRGLAFFYIPNDNVSKLRARRIQMAQDHGAQWVRDVESATHVIVDSKLSYKDVEKFITKAPSTAIVVNDAYPIDCIAFGKQLLNHEQPKYHIVGYTATSKSPPSGSEGTPQLSTLPLKAPQRNSKKWDFLPRRGTPPRSQELQQEPKAQIPSTMAPSASPNVVNLTTPPPAPSSGLNLPLTSLPSKSSLSEEFPRDELTECIGHVLKSAGSELEDIHIEDEDSIPEPGEIAGDVIIDLDEDSTDERQHKRRSRDKEVPKGRKDITFEEHFACFRGGTKDKTEHAANPNARTIEVLQQMCDYYESINDTFRPLQYRKAINTLRRQSHKITTAEEAATLPNVGTGIAQKIEEIVNTNRLRRLEYANEEPVDRTRDLFLKIYDVGLGTAERWIAKGYRTLQDLLDKADLTANQQIGIDHYDDLNSRIPRAEVTALGDCVKKQAAMIDPNVELLIGGSYRRGSESSSDIDFIVTKKGTTTTTDLVPFLKRLVFELRQSGFIVAVLAALESRRWNKDGGPGSKWHGCCVLPRIPGGANDSDDYRPVWRRIDFLLVPEAEYGAALIYFTGNDIFNRSMRLLASRKGMRLNQRGLYKDVARGKSRMNAAENELIEGRDEKRIFEILGVKWREPWERWC